MNLAAFTKNEPSRVEYKTAEKPSPGYKVTKEAIVALEQGVYAALETYSNVHRGSGHNSMVTTRLYEQARDIVLDYLGLKKGRYVVIFCSPRRAEILRSHICPGNCQILSSKEVGLPLGITAVVAKRKALPGGIPFQTGGGTARLVSPDQITWAQIPDRFEAGTPAIINVIAFAKSLQIMKQYGEYVFHDICPEKADVPDFLYHDELENYTGIELLNRLKQTLVGHDYQVPTREGLKPFINLDNGASTPTFRPIWDVVCKTWRLTNSAQQAIIPEVKSVCTDFLSAPREEYDVIFTSNTTEAINLVSESLSHGCDAGTEPVVLNTYLEHTSNDLPWRMIPSVSLIRLKVDAEGFIDLNEMETLLREHNQAKLHGKKHIKLVAVSGASNVTGTFNDLDVISNIVHHYGAQLLVDAAQLVAHRKVDMAKCRIDYLAFSAHKAYAPFGTGVLVVRKGLLAFSPSEMVAIRASGEENAAGIAALGKSLVLLQRIGMNLVQEEEQVLTRRTLLGLAQIPGLRVYGIKDPDSPRFAQKGGVIVFALNEQLAHRVGKALASHGGIGVRSGCHCAHLMIKRLLDVPLLLARFQHIILMLSHRISLPGLVRVSLGLANSQKDIDTLISVLKKISGKSANGDERPRQMATGKQKDFNRDTYRQQMNDFIRIITKKVYS